MSVYEAIRPLLFRLDPETAHRWSIRAMQCAGATALGRRLLHAMFGVREAEPVVVCGLAFPNRVGLAAGYDKDAHAWRGLASLGFGHVEVGTVTPRPQPGNPAPRVFRLSEHASLINRLGFPGEGAAAVAARIDGGRPHGVVLGVNIGKNRDTPLEEAARDYRELVGVFADRADYLVVNVSSPNTEGLRRLQAKRELEALLGDVVDARDAAPTSRRVPLFVKLSPDLDDDGLDDALEATLAAGIDGVVATNTTVSRPGVGDGAVTRERGGLSGQAVRGLSSRVVGQIHRRTEGRLPIIGVGGVFDADDVQEKLDVGASLVQLYTGLIYRGPFVVRRILRALAR
ncbi:MAG: quinone-dependent dihydroorotate dehydrogenase [Myxococcota bacterium]